MDPTTTLQMRLECIRMAAGMASTPSEVLDIAAQLYAFLTSDQRPKPRAVA